MTGKRVEAVVIFGLLLTSAVWEGESESISCDNQYFAELGKPYVIVCNASAEQRDMYWYKGGDASSFPILKIEYGRYGGQEYQQGEYEFTNENALKLINTQLKHEGKYTVRVFFNEFDFVTATTELKVYIRPDPPWTLIDACGSTCTGCKLNVTTSGSLSCYVNGSRPMMDVDWIVTNQSGVSFTKEEQTHEEMGDRWYTEKTIEYTTPDCGADATFKCMASFSDTTFVPLLDTYYSTVRINTGTSIQIETPDPSTQEMQEPKPKKKSLEERKNILVEGLMQHYEKLCFIKPLPWGEPIPIQALYTTCQCTVTNENGDVSHHASDFLSSPEFNFDTKRVFIIADLGFEKTTYNQHLVSDWVSKMKSLKKGRKDKMSEPILIYIDLKEVDPSMILSDLVKKMIHVGIDLTVDDIVKIFLNFEFQVLLDGLDELSMSTISSNTSAENPTNENEERANLLQGEDENDANLTVANLLENKINPLKFKNIKVWVTSREVEYMKASFTLPFSKVKLNGFSNPQVNEYIQKTCKYYLESQAIPQLTLLPKSNMKAFKLKGEMLDSNKRFTEDANNEAIERNIIANEVSDEVTTKLILDYHHELKQEESEQKDNTVSRNNMQTPKSRDTLEMLSKKVTECMELNEISQNFSETPLLLIMIIHIIICRMLDPTGKYKEVNVNKLSTIIRLVITCLESLYVQKVNRPNQSIQEDIKSLETRLGKIAFENKMRLSLGKREYWNDKLGKKDTQLALAVGLLKYSKKAESGGSQLEELAFSSYAGIMFYHEFFQEFLAAQYVPGSDKEWKWIDEFIKKSTDDATIRLLQFMFGMNHSRLNKAVKSLMKEQKMWNNLIDCIYEISNLEKKQAIINGMHQEASKLGVNVTINIQHLDRKHHRIALKEFCDACNAFDVKVKVMTFREECAIDFIKEITTPSLKSLIFFEMSINEDQFVSIITSVTSRQCPEILQFVKCSVPDELKEEAKQTVNSALKGVDMKIYNCKKTSPATMSVPKFNPKKGKWGSALFPKEL